MNNKQAKIPKETRKRSPSKQDVTTPKTQTTQNGVADVLGVQTFDQAHGNILANPNLSLAQRQELASSIGQAVGNQQLQLMLEQSGATTSKVQKEDGNTAARGGGSYEVVAGDSLWRIAKSTYGHGRYWRDIYRANPGKTAREGNLILIGTILDLPVLQVPAEAAPETVPETAPETAPEAAPETAPTQGGTEPAVGPIGMSTEFGSFEIYPDDFVGPLPVSVRNAETWPIKQTDFDMLQLRLTAVKEGSSNLSVNGSDTFNTAAYLDLAWLMTSGVGQELIQELQASGHAAQIIESAGGNSETPAVFDDGCETTDVPPQAGPGTDATVNYNPNRLFIVDGSLDWHTRPPAIGLAHELIHAWADMNGRSARGDTGGTPNYERQTVGLDEYRNDRLTENRFRGAFNLPLRPVY